MTRRALIVGLLLVMAVSATGCLGIRTVSGSGRVTEEEREVSGFTGVELATIGNLTIELGERESLHIEAEENLMRYLETEVRGETLIIDSRENVNLIPTRGVYFTLTVKELDTVVISGLGNVEVPDLQAPRFSVEISGGGNVDTEDLDVGTLEVDISGGGDVDVEGLEGEALTVVISGLGDLHIEEGEVEEQEILISGGGNYRARGMDSAEAEVRLSGLGSATVRVRDNLKVTISGGGSVEYFGSPAVEQDISGLGHVKQIGE
jgi:hypothetical protein